MKKLKIGLVFIGAIFIPILSSVAPSPAEVKVSVGIGIPLPPPLVIRVPPPVIPIPRTNVYFPPTIDVDILFFGGYWYRPYQDHWFRARAYNGPWVFVEPHRVPRAVIDLPPDYRRIPPGQRHIPYGQFKKYHDRWDRERYWDRDHDWRTEYWRPQGPPSKYRDKGYKKGKPKHDKWQEGGPPGHKDKGDKKDDGGHKGKGGK